MNKTVILIALLTLSGCATQTYHINAGNVSAPTVDESQTFFISGLGQEKAMNAASICGGSENIIKVESKHEFIDGLMSALTAGIYTPRHAKVYCKK